MKLSGARTFILGLALSQKSPKHQKRVYDASSDEHEPLPAGCVVAVAINPLIRAIR